MQMISGSATEEHIIDMPLAHQFMNTICLVCLPRPHKYSEPTQNQYKIYDYVENYFRLYELTVCGKVCKYEII